MRDFEKNPYSPDEARVAEWFAGHGIGGGDDPIGALIASHESWRLRYKHCDQVLRGG